MVCDTVPGRRLIAILRACRPMLGAHLLAVIAACALGAPDAADSRPKPKYRSFCYDDWLCEFIVNPSPMETKYLEMLVDEVARGGADVLVMNPAGMTASHPSRVWQTMWKAYAVGNRAAAFGSIPEKERPDHEALLKELTRFAQQKIDYLAHTFAACRKRGLATGVSIRMNDIHGVTWDRNYLVSDFWLENPRLRIPGTWFLNYAEAEVRAHFMRLIAETVDHYDIDVLDLDFWRNPYCFPPGNVDKHGEIMTAFVREVRKRIRESNKRITLLVKVPSSVATSRQQGFDVARWAKEGLVDGVILGGYLHAPWTAPIGEFRAAVGDRVAIYAGSDWFADTREGLPQRVMALVPELMRGFAAGQLANGADGIYWFNFVVGREAGIKELVDKPPHRDFTRPEFEVIGECNAPGTLRGKPKTCIAPNLTCHRHPLEATSQLPVALASGQEHGFELMLAREPDSAKVEVAVVFRSDAKKVNGLVLTRLNEAGLKTSATWHAGPQDAQTVRFSLLPSQIRDGLNRIAVRNGPTPIRVVALEVRVNSKGER